MRRATGASNVNATQKTISKTRENNFLYPENAIQKTISKRHSKGNQKIDTRGVKRMRLGISIIITMSTLEVLDSKKTYYLDSMKTCLSTHCDEFMYTSIEENVL